MKQSKKITVNLLHYSAPPVIGGVEVVIRDHYAILEKYGWNPRFVTGRGGKGFNTLKNPLLDSFNPVIKEMNRKLFAGTLPANFEKVKQKLKKFFEKLEGQLVVVHNVLSMPFNLAATAALHELQDKLKIIAWCHDHAWTMPAYRKLKINKYPWNLLIKKINGTYVTISTDRAKKIKSVLRVEPVIIPNGVNYAQLAEANPIAWRIFEEIDGFKRDFIFLYPTRILPRKNIELAINIISYMSKHCNPFLIITGPPDPHNEAVMNYYFKLKQSVEKKKLSNHVVFLYDRPDLGGSPSWQTLRALYRLCDALLFTSKDEGFGIPLIEASLLQKPVFCLKLPVYSDISNKLFFIPQKADEAAKFILKKIKTTTVAIKRSLMKFCWEEVYRQKIKPLLEGVVQNG